MKLGKWAILGQENGRSGRFGGPLKGRGRNGRFSGKNRKRRDSIGDGGASTDLIVRS
jgi:hypothetical protein